MFSIIVGGESAFYFYLTLNEIHRMKRAVLFCYSLLLHQFMFSQTASTVNVTGNPAVRSITNNVATVIDPELEIISNGTLKDFTVSITDSYTSGDALSYSGSLPSGITAGSFNATSRSIEFTGIATAEVWQEFLRRVTLKTTSAICNPESRRVSFTVGKRYYNPLNDHFYELRSAGANWTSARDYAQTQSYFGRQGYLVTITSQAENSFIYRIVNVNAWIGASDNFSAVNSAAGYSKYANQSAADGKYHWVTGPERGTMFTSQNAWQSGGVSPVNNRYNNWDNNEPNDWPGFTTSNPGEEDYGHIIGSNGRWNDYANGQSIASIIEYGGMPGDQSHSQVVFTKKITINNAPSGTISGGNTTVCSGTNSTALTLTGLSGSVVRWEYSLDNFLTAGTTVSSTSNSLTVSNLSQTRYYRAIVNSNSGCTGLATAATPIYVKALEAGNIVAQNNTICPGGTAQLSLYGFTGEITQWQRSASSDFSSDVTTISSKEASISQVLASIGTYYFRATVKAIGCSNTTNSAAYAITVSSGTAPVGGVVSGREHCGSSNSGSLQLTGHTGTIQKWQFSTDGGITWTDVANTTSTLTYNGVSSTRKYRAVLTNGTCGTAYSSEGAVTILGTNRFKWLGGSNRQAQQSTNWDCGNKPMRGSDVLISSTASNDMELDSDYVLGTIDFAGSNRKIVLGNHNLTINGVVGGNAQNHIITNGSGKLMIKVAPGVSAVYPVGNSSYNPIRITNNTGLADEISVRVVDEVYLNGSNGTVSDVPRVKRTWDISKANANGGNGLDFTFYWNEDEAINLVTPALYHFENNSWNKQPLTGILTGTNSLTYSGYTGSFSPFAIGDAMISLPADWKSFTASRLKKSVILNWETFAEYNTQDYLVQHSVSGTAWTTIGSVLSNNSSQTIQRYQFEHVKPVAGVNHYRIMQRDQNGRTRFSKVLAIKLDADAVVSIYPNPVTSGQLTVQMETAGLIQVYNQAGIPVYQTDGKAGLNRLDLSLLSKGMYTLKCGLQAIPFLVK